MTTEIMRATKENTLANLTYQISKLYDYLKKMRFYEIYYCFIDLNGASCGCVKKLVMYGGVVSPKVFKM